MLPMLSNSKGLVTVSYNLAGWLITCHKVPPPDPLNNDTLMPASATAMFMVNNDACERPQAHFRTY